MKPIKILILTCFLIAFSLSAKSGEIEDFASGIIKDSGNKQLTLTVFYLSNMIETPVRVTPDLIRKFHTYQYVTSMGGSTMTSVPKFLQIVGGEKVESKQASDLDCRWVFIVSDSTNHEKLVIYTNSFFSMAFANGTWFRPSHSFKAWTNAIFRNAFDLEDIIKDDQ